MSHDLILASGSTIRRDLLLNANVKVEVKIARVDEDAIKAAMLEDGVKPRDLADALAEAKARKVSLKSPGSFVLGCDQVLDFEGTLLSKPGSQEQALTQLKLLNSKVHKLFSAAVIYQDGQPVWRHIGEVKLHMRQSSGSFLEDYVSRNWDSIQHSVGAYKLEEEGVRLFQKIEGDYFNVLGLPLLEVLAFLTLRGVIQG